MTTEFDRSRRDDEDAALVIALLAVTVEPPVVASSHPLWGDPAYTLRSLPPARTSWWASGLPG